MTVYFQHTYKNKPPICAMKQLYSKSSIISVHPNGIIEFCFKPDWDQPDTAEIAIDNALTLKKAVGDNICGLLVYAPSLYVKKEVLEAFAKVPIGHIASAIVVNSVGSRIFANLLLKFVKTSSIKKIFNNPEKAKQWLLKQIEAAKQQ